MADKLILVSHPLCPYVQRAAISLTEKGVPFERIDIDLADKPDWFKAISPLGKVPLLRVQRNGEETVIFESAVILEFLEETQANPLHPVDAYARALKQRYVYTPETVVDGIGHDPGVSLEPITSLLADAQRRSPKRATPELTRSSDGVLTIKLGAFKLDGPADVVLAVYDRRHSTPVHEGENGGRTLENFNIVRHFETVSRWDGSAASWTVPADRFKPEQGMAVLVQRTDLGPMVGCNKLEPMVTG